MGAHRKQLQEHTEKFKEQDAKLTAHDNRIDALEKVVKSGMSVGVPTSAGGGVGSSRNRHIPSHCMVKRWCTWEQRDAFGASRAEAEGWMQAAQELLSAKNAMYDGVLTECVTTRTVNHAFDIYCKEPTQTLDCVTALRGMLTNERLKIKGRVVKVVPEHSPEDSAKYSLMGEMIDNAKEALEQKGLADTWEVDSTWKKVLKVYIVEKRNGQTATKKLVCSIGRHGELVIDQSTMSFLGTTEAAFRAGAV